MKVKFNLPQEIDSIHRVRNFAEDVQKNFLQSKDGAIENFDDVTYEIVILVSASRHRGRVLSLIKTTLKRHNLFENASIEK